MRRFLFQIHLWTGLLSGLLMVMFGLTGSAVVFLNEQEDWLNQKLVYIAPPVGENVERVGLQTIVSAARQAQPSLEVNSISLPDKSNRSIAVQMRQPPTQNAKDERAPASQILLYVNPYSGEIIGTRDRSDSTLRFVRVLHSNLHYGKTGRTIVGVFGLLLALLCITGIAVWATGKRNLKINRRVGWKRINWDLHNAVGVYSLIFIFVIAITGAYFAWSQETAAAVNWLTNSPERLATPRPKELTNGTAAQVSLDEIVARADAALPTDRTVQIVLPTAPTGAITVIKQPPAEVSAFERSRVFLDNSDGEVLRIEDVRASSLGSRILSFIAPLHFGIVGGVWTRILWALMGLVLPLLFITGFLMWWNRVVRKRIR